MLPITDPATGEVIREVPLADSTVVASAIDAAAAAWPKWRDTSLTKRASILNQFRNLLSNQADDLASLVCSEHGKVPADAAGEITRGLENADYATGLIEHLKGEYSEQVATGVDIHSIRQPIGVVACITPFNFPLMVPLWMVCSAIACGNTVVLKPSEKDPSASVAIARLFAAAGLPSGVLNVVHGQVPAVQSLIESETVQAVSFVGSTPVAKEIYRSAAATGKRVQALGGAKNHMVVLPDADLSAAADAAVSAGYGSAGERCMAISVVVAVGNIADELVSEITQRTQEVKVGPGTDPSNEMGPLISAEHRDRVSHYLAQAEGEGAEIVIDGRAAALGNSGYFLGPSLVDRVTSRMSIYREEIFGPVLSVVRAETYAEAIGLINAHRYGNGAAIFTRDGAAARAFEFDVEAGMVGINVPIPVPIGSYSFGGWNESLFGDTHIYGPDSFRFYTRSKVTTSRWPDPATSKVDLGFPTNQEEA